MPWHLHPESDCYFWSMRDYVDQCVQVPESDVPDHIRARPFEHSLREGQHMATTVETRPIIEGVSERVVEEAFETRAAIGDPEAAGSLPPDALVNDEKLVKVFVKIRDAKRDFVKAHEAELAEKFEKPLAQIQTELKRRLMGRANTGLKTEYGTVYLAEILKVACQDWAIFHSWIKENDALDFLEQRVKAGEVKTYMETHAGELPPGLSVFRESEARVRKPTKRGSKAVGEEAADES